MILDLISLENPFNGRLELWIGNIHIHHNFFGIVLMIIGLNVYFKSKRWGIILIIMGILLIVQWYICYPEAGLGLITRGR